MRELKEFAIALVRVVLGLVVLLGALILIDLVTYISFTGSTSPEKILAAYDDGYDLGYNDTYELSYQEAHGMGYAEGYDKGYEIGRSDGLKEEAAILVELHNPTHKELLEFLAGDKTDSNLFISGEYVCFDFAAALNNNAEASGIRAAYVRIRSKEWGHAVVAFETVDSGLVFIEPQSDEEVRPVIGEPYPWQRAGAVGSAHWHVPIVEIQVIW